MMKKKVVVFVFVYNLYNDAYYIHEEKISEKTYIY